MSIVERERVEEVVAPREATIADVLERAAYRMEEEIEPWCQGIREGMACMGYAIARASVDLGFVHPESPDEVGSSWFGWAAPLLGVHSIPGWNDTQGRTKTQVVAALLTAAAKARV